MADFSPASSGSVKFKHEAMTETDRGNAHVTLSGRARQSGFRRLHILSLCNVLHLHTHAHSQTNAHTHTHTHLSLLQQGRNRRSVCNSNRPHFLNASVCIEDYMYTQDTECVSGGGVFLLPPGRCRIIDRALSICGGCFSLLFFFYCRHTAVCRTREDL